MGIEERNKNLDRLLGILPPIIEEKQIVPQKTNSSNNVPEIKEPMNDNEKYKEELNKNRKRLNNIYKTAKEVLESSASIATEFNKSRDVEAFAEVLKAMTDIVVKKSEMDEKLYKPKEDGINGGNIETQNNLIVTDTRTLNNIIKKDKEDRHNPSEMKNVTPEDDK